MNTIQLPKTSKLLANDFVFGVATSSFQIEGAAEDRLPCIWDVFCAKEGTIADGSDGLVACDHVNRWKDDIDLVKRLGVDAYRFSISWPRVMNQDGTVNAVGLALYSEMLDYMIEKGLKTYVTLYHWDLPQYLEDAGGWLNRQTAHDFCTYVEAVTRAFADKVDSWCTLNEPFCAAYLGYETGIHAPGITGRENGRTAAHHLLLAHGLAMKVLRKNCPDTPSGIVLNMSPCYPETETVADVQAAKYASEYLFEWFLSPLVNGCYPKVIDQLQEADKPPVQDGDMDCIAAPLDWLGLNYYTRDIYKASDNELFEYVIKNDYPKTEMGWEIYPKGLTDLLGFISETYTLPPLVITENGAAMADYIEGGEVHDPDRLDYLNTHMNAVDQAIVNGANVIGYFAWSLMDNFEWAEGYERRFGIVYVDFETQERTIKTSGKAYRDFLHSIRG